METARGANHVLAALTWGVEELGIATVYRAPRDVKLLCLLRSSRMFGFGALTLIMVSFLHELEISQTGIGLFMSLTMGGDVLISVVLAIFADRIGRRAVLCLGAVLMAVCGTIFAVSDTYGFLLTAAILGVISPNGNETGPFKAIEESTLAHLTNSWDRNDIYAWYTVSGTIGAAFGIMSCGWTIHYLHLVLGWPLLDAYRVVFYCYTAVGLTKILIVSALSSSVELEKGTDPGLGPDPVGDSDETTPLIADNDQENGSKLQPTKSSRGSILPTISRDSIRVMSILCTLFALDSFATGLAPLAWVTFFFSSHFGLEEGELGTIFFITRVLAAISMILASPLAKRFGNVKTMVFTHLPSALFLALIPVPDNVHISITFLMLRGCLQAMSIAPRSTFVAAIVLPEERTMVMGLVNVVRTTAQSVAPLVTGFLVEIDLFWTAFVAAGSLRACYDIGLLVLFVNRKGHKEGEEDDEDDDDENDRI
ncbi:related to Staphylococcus multidrug resistance protein [Cephalotrichum gorgonifer]|uniref:Related to Staphylococcus multidrug resistance protein n=1 Tax=Cephalotrichum gorgonifer TaxID=2041049 RepID=A0AAE8N7K7_9PEZI|nr:related to Staphylococcus multidrug resistance protein [Cephalotrichum gorgonifer]